MNELDFDCHVAEANATGGWVISQQMGTTFPYYDVVSKATSLAYAITAQMQKGSEVHSVVAAVRYDGGAPDFSLWCGDKFLDVGGLTTDMAELRCKEASALSAAPIEVAANMMRLHATQPASAPCDFWLNWRRTKSLCEHTKAFLTCLRQEAPNFKAELLQGYDDAVTAPPAPAALGGSTLALSELAFWVPVLIEGDRGAGKTVEARAFARTNGYPRVELGGHEGTEALDMLGYSIQAPSGAMVWKDGAVSEAFRLAKTTKVVLIIDEILRIPVRQLSLFLTALSPDEGHYRLRTGRIIDVVDGVAREEELECPVQNLCIIATTNVGSEYAVDEIDPALAERFVLLRKDTNAVELKRILMLEAKVKKFPAKVVNNCMTFFTKMVEARARGLVARTPTTRTLVRAILIAKEEADVLRVLRTQILLWVARTSEGQPVPEQVETVDGLLTRFYK